VYRALGRVAIRFSLRYMRARYRRRLRIGLAIVGVGAVAGIVAYLTAREVPEG
jgi:ABC-type lipoprotein release transport system permease subunit